MGFKPTEKEERPEGQRSEYDPLPDGRYILAMVHFTNQSGRVRGKWRVLFAPHDESLVGQHVWIGFSINYKGSPGAARWLSTICMGMGLTQEDEFEPRDPKDVRTFMCGRALACELHTKESPTINQKTKKPFQNPEFKKLIMRTECRPETLQMMAEWERHLKEEEEERKNNSNEGWGGEGGAGDDGSPEYSDDDAPASGYRF